MTCEVASPFSALRNLRGSIVHDHQQLSPGRSNTFTLWLSVDRCRARYPLGRSPQFRITLESPCVYQSQLRATPGSYPIASTKRAGIPTKRRTRHHQSPVTVTTREAMHTEEAAAGEIETASWATSTGGGSDCDSNDAWL